MIVVVNRPLNILFLTHVVEVRIHLVLLDGIGWETPIYEVFQVIYCFLYILTLHLASLIRRSDIDFLNWRRHWWLCLANITSCYGHIGLSHQSMQVTSAIIFILLLIGVATASIVGLGGLLLNHIWKGSRLILLIYIILMHLPTAVNIWMGQARLTGGSQWLLSQELIHESLIGGTCGTRVMRGVY